MKLKNTKVATLAVPIFTFESLAERANAALTITLDEVGGNLNYTVSGSINLDALGAQVGLANGFDAVGPALGAFATTGITDLYEVDISNWSSFGSGTVSSWSSSTGDAIALFTDPRLGLPTGYISGNQLSASGSLTGGSFASQGITEGTFVTTLTNGVNSDNVTIITLAIPEPSSALLLGIGLLGVIGRRHRPK